MLAGNIGRERQEAPVPPPAAQANDEPILWGSIRPPEDDSEAFDDT